MLRPVPSDDCNNPNSEDPVSFLGGNITRQFADWLTIENLGTAVNSIHFSTTSRYLLAYFANPRAHEWRGDFIIVTNVEQPDGRILSPVRRPREGD